MADPVRLPSPVAPPPDDPPDDLEKFGALIAEQLLEIRKSIPAAPDAPLAPVVNVSAAPAEVTVNVAPSEMTAPVFAPVVNVETVAPNIIVQPAGPVINLETDAVNLHVNIEDVVGALAAMTTIIGAGNDFLRMVGTELKRQSDSILALADALNAQSERNAESAAETTQAVRAIAKAMTAPRSIVSEGGKPVRVVVGKG